MSPHATLEPIQIKPGTSPKLSLAMIVKDEEAIIERVLACAKNVCDELIVVDTGSNDRTVELAQRAGARVLHFDWIEDFAAARNFAFDHCTGEWILWLDADDILDPTAQQQLHQLKDQLNDHLDGIFLDYQITFDPHDCCTFSTLRERLIRRDANLRWEYPIHECIALPAGRSKEMPEISVQHRPLPEKQAGKVNRNLNILRAVVEWGDRRPRNLFYLANELKDHGRFQEAVEVYEEYLTVSDLPWEKYWALFCLIRCYYQLGESEKARHFALQAVLLDSQRAEGYIQLGLYHYDRREWARAAPYFQLAVGLEKPTQGFSQAEAYSWLPQDYLSVCYANQGRYSESIRTALDVLPVNPHKQRLIQNLHWMIDRL